VRSIFAVIALGVVTAGTASAKDLSIKNSS
jgi:hypothetical protein